MAKPTLQGRVKLWQHQADALSTAQEYLRRQSRASAPPRSALINIPTGGGKTAIIALLAHEGYAIKRALVLAPRLAIRDQLQLELSGRRPNGFFQKQGIDPSDLRRSVSILKEMPDIVSKGTDGIFVSTIQLIDRYRQKRPQQFSKFAGSIDVLLVDEGHYEPARSWSVTIRGFNKPAILFTATPYRNDLRAFAIDPDAIHVTRFRDAQRDRFIRGVEVVQAKSKNTPAAFADSVLQCFTQQFGKPPDESHKLIVRCERKDDVAKMGAAFKQKGLTVVGLHERFTAADTKADPWKLRVPPDPETAGAPAIWVHQHKLLEGVDGPSFRAVALYGPLGSVRALVQQVGRIIRNPGRKANQSALVMDHRAGRIARNWERFLQYDDALTKEGLTRGAPDIVQESLGELPPLDYIAENFRERFDLEMDIDVAASIAVPTSAHFLNTAPSFKLARFLDGVRDSLDERALTHRHFTLDADRHVFLYIAWRNSPLLRDHYFVELALHAILIRSFQGHFSYFDTGGGAPLREDALAVEGPVGRERLSRLMSRAAGTRITGVSTRNSALGRRAVRTRSVSAASIGDTVPYLDDFQHVATSMTGASREAWRLDETMAEADEHDEARRRTRATVRRYLGLGRGHITEMGSRVTVAEYFSWVESAEEKLLSKRAPVEVFNRYARALAADPEKPDPRNILLDLEEARELFETLDRNGLSADQRLELEDACSDCKPAEPGKARAFEVRGHGKNFLGSVRFDPTLRRYIIESRDLAESFHQTGDRPGPDLVTFLNSQQAFTVLPDTTNVLYADGAFFSPDIGTGANFDPDRFPVGKILFTYAELNGILSEKGDKAALKATRSGWHSQSVFGWFDDNLDRLLDRPSLVVCDDMGTESADFIALDQDASRVVLIHCKGRPTRSIYSASALHEVCGQAVKNCGTLNFFNPLKPPNVKRWHEPWHSNAVDGVVKSRVRRGDGRVKTSADGERLWGEFERAIRDPNAEREVWLVLGSTLSKKGWETELKKPDPAPEAIQATHLLRSVLASIGGANARLKILCSP